MLEEGLEDWLRVAVSDSDREPVELAVGLIEALFDAEGEEEEDGVAERVLL